MREGGGAHDAVGADIGERREVHAGEGVEAHGALLACAGSRDDDAAERDRHVARVVVGCVQHALVQVELRVGEGARHGALRPGEHDGLGAVLDEIRQGCRGVCHGVGAVQHHEPVVVVVAFHDGAGDAQPVARAHVGRVDVHGLFHVERGEVCHLGNVPRQFLA